MRACVTGGAGFIGSHLVDRLLSDGHEVSVLDDLSTGSASNLEQARARIDLVVGDVRDAGDVARAVRGAEVVFHQAALVSVARSVEDPKTATDVNVLGTLNVLLAARDLGARRVVFASSSSVYGDAAELPKHEGMSLAPRSPYAATKAAGEAYLSAFQAGYGLETVSLRYFNVYGPRQSAASDYAAVIPRFLEAARDGRAPVVYGDGLQTRDFAYVADVIEALCLAAQATRALEGPMNVGAGRRTSVLELATLVGEVSGATRSPVHAPGRPGDVRDSLASVERAQDRLGWRTEVPLQEGILRTWQGGAPGPG